MEKIEKIYNFLAYQVEIPKIFGVFHFVSIAVVLLLTIIVCISCKNSSEKTERKIAFWVWTALLILESYKQFIYHFSTEDGFTLDYSWHGFPFQLCSSPLYVLPFIAFLPSGKVREAFVSFFEAFVLFGGVVVCAFPGNVLVETLGINFHTMFWHGSQVVLGIYFNVRRFVSKNPPNIFRHFSSSIPIFLTFVSIAEVINNVFYRFATSKGIEDEFNMFFISSHFECPFPVLNVIQPHVPHAVFIISYVLFVLLFSFILMATVASIAKRSRDKITA